MDAFGEGLYEFINKDDIIYDFIIIILLFYLNGTMIHKF